MGFIDKLFKREEPTEPTEQITPEQDALLQAILSGKPVGRQQAMSVPAVAAAVDKLANTVAMLPVRLYQETSDGDNRRKVTEMHGDPRIKLLNVDTNDTLDTFQFKKTMATDYLIDKGAFAFIDKKNVEFTGLYHIAPTSISFAKNADPIYKTVTYLVGERHLQPFQLIIMLRQTEDGIMGASVVSEIQKALQTAVENIAFELGLVRKGGSKKGFLESDKNISDDAMKKLRAAWQSLYSNDEESIVVLNNGVKFKEASTNSVEMQLNERKKQLAAEINAIFHVYDDYDRTVREGVMPIVNAFEAALSRNLLTEEEKATGFYYGFDTKEITKGDIKTRYDAYKTAAEAGWLTKNEIRYEEDKDPIEGLDVVGLGLGDVLYNTKTQEYYTPNTGEVKSSETTGSEPFGRSKRQALVAAGLAVVAEDTGRVLMLQRANDEEDPAGGSWEFPGGHIEQGENPLAAAFREWSEEVGRRVPAGKVIGQWASEDGKYVGFLWSIAKESIIKLGNRSDITNPDDPDHDTIEAIAWYEPEQLPANPAVREELAKDIEKVVALTEGVKE